MGALSLLLAATGAVLAFAVADQVEGVDLYAAGLIMLIAGGIGLIVSIVRNGFFGVRSHTERTVSADGRTVVEDHTTTSA